MAMVEDDWLKNLLGPETMTLAVPAETIVRKQGLARKQGQSYVTPPSLRKSDAVPAPTVGANGRPMVVAVKVEPSSEQSDSDTALSAVPSNVSDGSLAKRREKRSRKQSAAPTSTDGGYASGGESPTSRPRHAAPARGTSSRRNSDASTAPSMEVQASLASLDSLSVVPSTTDDFAELSLMSPALQPADAPKEGDALMPGLDGDDANDNGLDGDGNRRKVRHNLTERRRVDRMNQLFNRLYTAIEETAPATGETDKATGQPVLGVLGADGKPINPNRWSKADVLEGALNVITDLRRQLTEERLARTLGVPVDGDHEDTHDGLSSGYAHSQSAGDTDAEGTYADSDVHSEPSDSRGALSMTSYGMPGHQLAAGQSSSSSAAGYGGVVAMPGMDSEPMPQLVVPMVSNEENQMFADVAL